MDERAIFGQQEESAASPMRIVLFEQKGKMHSLWLPPYEEGLYRFETPDYTGEEIPVSVVTENGAYYAQCARNGRFRIDHTFVGQRVELHNRTITTAVFSDRSYVLYAEVEKERGNVFLPYRFEEKGQITIGRLPECDICYQNKNVSRRHARLVWENERWYVMDDGSINGTYVNRRKVPCAPADATEEEKLRYKMPLSLGDIIYIVGLYLIIGVGYIAINNADERCITNIRKIRPLQNLRELTYTPCPRKAGVDTFDRQPRRRLLLKPDPIEIESPPMPLSENKIPLILRMGNPLLSGGRAIATGNMLSAVSSMILPGLTQMITEKDRKEYEAKRKKVYGEYLAAKAEEISKELSIEHNVLNQQYPEINGVLRFAEDGSRLWERQKRDEDFLTIRLGYGNIPMLAKKQYTPKRFELEPDPLNEDMYRMAEATELVCHAPVLLDLREHFVCGILGPKPNAVALIRNLVMQFSLTHAYDELKLILIVHQSEMKTLNFVRYLPHNWDNERSIRFFATTKAEAQQVSKHLIKLYGSVASEGKNSQNVLKNNPAYVIFATNKELYDGIEVLQDITQEEKYPGISVITAFQEAPKESRVLINVGEKNDIVYLRNPELQNQEFVFDEPERKLADRAMRSVMQTRLALGTQQYALPAMLTFLEMYNAGKVEHLTPLKRWEESNPVKSLAAPIGVGTDGRIFTLDLHEKRQGPHGLVAGMTGSGKSEFIITYILSMAVNYSPDEVAFILIDYKGGGLADAFVDAKRGIHLPHVVGTITNLDGSAIKRSLLSIHSELKRRQEIFKAAKSATNTGTMDIYDYQKFYRQKRVSEPLPHLFIISDEFAELKKQQPEFMDELISTARIGRSLGVHLILATQKPTGVVNDQIWSNTKFRICLKVQDKGDSMEMLKRPEAAELKNTGRFYLQVGYNEMFALGQSAWCGAGYTPQDEVISEVDDSARFVDLAGQTLLEAHRKTTAAKASTKQIVAIVQYLSDLAKREGLTPRSLWQEPLPATLDYGEIVAREGTENPMRVLMGMVDDPEHQTQFPLSLDVLSMRNMLLCGESGSGKSTFLNTMLYALTKQNGPQDLNYYIVDLSGGAMSAFRSMPHCGAYLTEESENDFDRLMELIKDIIARRKELFRQADVTSFEAYRKKAPLPLILVVFDSYMNLLSFRRGAEYHSGLYDYLRTGAAFGIRYVLSANHFGEVHSRARQEIDSRIALRAKDRYEYTDILETRCTSEPDVKPGRGMCVVEGRPLEFHTAMLDPTVADNERLPHMRKMLDELAASYALQPCARRLSVVTGGEDYRDFCGGAQKRRIPIGYHIKDAKRLELPLKQFLCLPLYFGNPLGVRPVLDNLLWAFAQNGADIVLVRRRSDSRYYRCDLPNVRLFDCNAADLTKVSTLIKEELTRRNVLRDRYCEQNGIPSSDPTRVRKAISYIAENTRPMLFLFESLGDICRLPEDEKGEVKLVRDELKLFFERMLGYNIYFVGGFYPEDSDLGSGNALVRTFAQEQLLLLFGGRYDKQILASNLPSDFRRMEKVNPKYDRFLLKYRDEYYQALMPCGELQTQSEDPDDRAML